MMKHLFFYIVCFFALFNRSVYAYEAPQLPDDFEGPLTREYIANIVADDTYTTSMLQNLNIYYEIGSYLYQKYPWEQIVSDDFTDKIRPFFPYDTEEQLKQKHDYLVKTAYFYQKGREFYTDMVNRYLVPHVYRKVHDATEYDHDDEVQYIPTADDEYVKVYNFKKFLSYSNNQDELNAISDFERKQENNNDILVQFDRIMEKIDWKKVWLYGTVYKNPLFSDLGIGKAAFGDGINVRLLARQTYTEGKTELDYGLQIVTHPRYFVLANNLSKDAQKPQIDFAGSQNVAEAQILYPIPQKTGVLPQAHKYFGNFIIPVKIRPQDPDKAVDIAANVTLSVCDFKLDCKPQHFALKLHSDVAGADKFDNGFDNLFFHAMRRIPNENTPYITSKQLSVVDTPAGKELLWEAETEKNIKNIEAYIENAEEFVPFAAPRYLIDGNKIQIYFKPLSAQTDLEHADYIISVNLNNRIFGRYHLVPNGNAAVLKQNLSAADNIMSSAFICGLLLNFMPCIAPLVLLLLILYLRISKKYPSEVRKCQISVLKGSIIGILSAAVIFTGQQYSGHFAVWGRQFSYTPLIFCLLMIFAALTELFPHLSSLITQSDNPHRRNFFLAAGFIVGLATTVSGAPYLSKVMNIAATSPILGAYSIILCLIAGFSLPQFLLLYLSGKTSLWKGLNNFQRDMVRIIPYAFYCTLLWFWLFIAFACGFINSAVIIIIAAVWMFCCNLYGKYLDYLNGALDERITLNQLNKIRRSSVIFMGVLLLFFVSGGIYATRHLQINRQPEVAQTQIVGELQKLRAEGKPILVIIEADWCFKCRIYRFWTLNPLILRQWKDRYDLHVIRMNKTADLAEYMPRYRQYALPFYILYTRKYPEGLVLTSDIEISKMELFMD